MKTPAQHTHWIQSINSRGRGQWIFLAAITVLFLVSFKALNVFSQSESTPSEPKLVVSSQVIELLPGYHTERYFSALVQAQQSVSVASEIAGKVTRAFVDDGEMVKSGQALFELDSQILTQQKLALVAQQKSLKADRNLAKKRLNRQKNLKQQSFSSEDTIDALNSQIESLNATLQQLEAQTRDIEIRLEKSTVFAPFSGQIQRRLVDQGAVINAGTPVFELIDNSALEIQVGLPVALVKQITINDIYPVEQAGKQLNVRATAVLPKIDPLTQTQGVKFLADQNESLIPGDYVRLKMPSYHQTPGFWIPNSALIEGEKGLWQLFVIDEENRVNKQSVSIIYPGNPNSFVSANLNTGNKVVVKGVHRLANRVAVIDETSLTAKLEATSASGASR